MISLIANSGIQIHKFDLLINPNDDVSKPIRFHEWFDVADLKIRLEYAHKLKAEDVIVSKKSLFEEGYIDENGKISDNVNLNLLEILTQGQNAFSINDIETCLEQFENHWIPIPYFEQNSAGHSLFGPTNWCRLKLIQANDDKVNKKYKAILAFDTTVHYEVNNPEQPYFQGVDDSNFYSICNDLQLLLNYCKESHECGWVDEFVSSLFFETPDKAPKEFPTHKYLGYYIYFINYLNKLKVFPDVKFYKDNQGEHLNIDLVLDIGNSRTCGLLFDSSDTEAPFSKVKKLVIQNFTDVEKSCDDPFDMRLAFHKADFGDIRSFEGNQFTWPSILRVGKEAKSLIYLSKNENEEGKEKITNHSSPKRYLWDGDESNEQWEYIKLEGTNPIKTIYLEGISEQFNSDGSFNPTTDYGLSSSYSKRSLMTFVFLEILAHANVQINSFNFRKDHGDFSTPRKLKRIIITCPTAMPQEEQLILRSAAEEATIVLDRFFKGSYNQPYESGSTNKKIEIIPSVSDLKKNLEDIDDKKDWQYDEATCNQLVFIYAEISQRYLNKCETFFNLYGKKRHDLGDYSKKSLTVGSIDIGAGTTDLMICSYKYNDEGKAVLTPVPQYWESFNFAGDDLLKEIVQQVILEGRIKNEKYRGCCGVIQNYLIEHGVNDVESKMNRFFGIDSNAINYEGIQRRKDFNIQILVPIALRYLDMTRRKSEDEILTYNDFFPLNEPRPSDELLEGFQKHFGVDFTEINWKFSQDRINDIIETVFEPLMKKLSTLLFAQGCDIVLLAGKPTSLHKMEDLFLKFYPVSPDRIVTLNNYRVGLWYPFADGNGYFEDQKSLVAVGAMIALLGGKLDRFQSFKLNMEVMKKKLLSTSLNIGLFDRNISNIKETLITPYINKGSALLNGLPVLFGAKQIDTKAYPSRLLYQLDFNTKQIEEKIRQNKGIEDPEILASHVELFKRNMKMNMPFRVKFSRQFRSDREKIHIESITDSSRDELSNSLFELKLKTMASDKGYWLDNGEFILSIRERE